MPTINGTAGNDVLTATDGSAGTFTLISAAANGTAQNGTMNGTFFASPDGKWVVFSTTGATNLTSYNPGNVLQLYLKNQVTGEVTLLTVTAGGTVANGGSFASFFSADSSKLYFTSTASNIAPSDHDATRHSFVKDLTTGVITEIGLGVGGANPNGFTQIRDIGPGGMVLFDSLASNLIPGVPGNQGQVYILDTSSGNWRLVSSNAAGQVANAGSSASVFSPDGSKVAFSSVATNLVANDTNRVADIFLKDLTTGEVTLISASSAGQQGNARSGTNLSLVPAGYFSPDGSKFLFQSDASNLVANDTNGVSDLFIKDLVTGAITRVSTNSDGVQANGENTLATFSPDGNKVIFTSTASNLVAGDTNNTLDIFIKDLTTGAVTRLTNFSNQFPLAAQGGFTPDGAAILFLVTSSLVAGDNNGATDLYKFTLPGPSPISQTMNGGDGNDVIIGGSNIDKLSGDAGDDKLYGGGGADQLFGGTGVDLLKGDDGADRLDGGADNDTLYGGKDNDYLDGGSGADIMYGGADNDVYIVDDAGDRTIEFAGEGIDVVRASVSWTLSANTENLELQGSGDLNGTGNDLANNITGTSGNNILDGGDGGDTLDGGFGNDRLIGGKGNDTMTGGYGADTFVVTGASVMSSKAGGGVLETDFVKDLNKLQGDKLDLSAIDADINTAGDQAFTLVGAFTKHAGEMTLAYTAATNLTVLTLDVDGDGKADYVMKITGDVHLNSGGWIL